MKITGKKELGAGKWLALEQLEYTDFENKTRFWETVSRKRCAGAVVLIVELLPSHRLILIRQYRPPADALLIEFPAGLIDPGETPESAALRELREETGYIGTIRELLPPAYNSPGLTGEFVVPVLMEVDETAQEELKTDFDDSEHIETFLVPRSGLSAFLRKAVEEGAKIDAKVMAYALALR